MMTPGTVRIKMLPGGLYRVALDPAVPLLRRLRPFVTFDKACGFACHNAITLGRELRDDTGRLSAGQCDELVEALTAVAAS